MTSPKTDAEPIVARDAIYHRAPDALRERVQADIAREARRESRPTLWRWGGIAAAIAASAVLGWNAALLRSAGDDAIARDVVAAHVRSMMSEARLNDVVSTDQHTVKPWFQGRVDFAPRVADPASIGFALAGGRLDFINGRKVAAITYRHRLHVVNVFQWPADAADSAPEITARQGFTLARWRRGGIESWAISDTAEPDMTAFARALFAS